MVVGILEMNELQQAQLASQLLNGLAPLFTGSFLLGLLVGVFFFARLVDSIDRLGERLRRPKRIKRAGDFNEFGNFEYLYLFQGKYYSLGEYEDLKKKARENKGSSL